MKITADTHVHLYQCYDIDAAIEGLIRNMDSVAPAGVRAAFLAEREGCDFFDGFRSGTIRLKSSGLVVGKTGEDDAVVFLRGGKPELYMFAGRQFVSRERIEVLGLACNLRAPGGIPARDIVRKVLDAGGIPVLSWAPGKWFFSRGKVVRSLLDAYGPGQLLVGDTAMRPVAWGEPSLMKYARGKGFAVIAGSDPLPFVGDEKYAGSYCSVLEGDFSGEKPVSSLRRILSGRNTSFVNPGRRCGLMEMLSRMKKNAAAGSFTLFF